MHDDESNIIWNNYLEEVKKILIWISRLYYLTIAILIKEILKNCLSRINEWQEIEHKEKRA